MAENELDKYLSPLLTLKALGEGIEDPEILRQRSAYIAERLGCKPSAVIKVLKDANKAYRKYVPLSVDSVHGISGS